MMLSKATLLKIGLTIIVAGILIFPVAKANNNTVVITLTEDGFKPKKVQIEKGQTVKFRTNVEQDFWPASDSHPTHNLNPLFDSEEPIPPSKSWSFTFDTPGSWTFHDHLRSQFTGKIVVLGNGGESLKECLKEVREESLSAHCWERKFATIISTKGLATALKVFSETYSEDLIFKRNCHDVMHYIGDAAYMAYQTDKEQVLSRETSYCGYGFYHGFIEAALAEKGPGALIEARNYCDNLSESLELKDWGILTACQHGVGHAVFDSIESTYWGDDDGMIQVGISRCERTFSDQEARNLCVSGIFNSYAIAVNANFYNLSYNQDDPVLICKQQKELYQKYCFAEVGIHYIKNKNYSFSEFLNFVNGLRDYKSIGKLVSAYADEKVRGSEKQLEALDLKKICSQFNLQQDLISCIEGVVVGLRGSIISVPQLKETKNTFCDYWKDNTEAFEFCSEAYKFKP